MKLSRKQRGFTLVEAGIVVLIGALISVNAAHKVRVDSEELSSKALGEQTLMLGQSFEKYIYEHYTNLSSDPTLPAVTTATGIATPMSPTFAGLQAAGYIPTEISNRTVYAQQFGFRVVRSGTCPGSSCNVYGLVYPTTPVLLPNGAVNEGVALTAMEAVGARGGFSPLDTPGTVRGFGGTWTATNPVSSGGGGLVFFMAGGSLSALNAFYRKSGDTLTGPMNGGNQNISNVNNLQVNNTITTNILTGNTVRVSNGVCDRAYMSNTGIVAVRDPSCVERVQMDGTNGRLVATSSTGLTTAVVGTDSGAVQTYSNGVQRLDHAASTGVTRLFNGVGSTTHQLDSNTGTTFSASDVNSNGVLRSNSNVAEGSSQLRSRGVYNPGGDLFLETTSGRNLRLNTDVADGSGSLVSGFGLNRFTNQVQLDAIATEGAACPENGRLARTAAGDTLFCSAGIWKRAGLPPGTAGAACTTNGALGQAPSGTTLVCINNIWMNIEERFGRLATVLITIGTHNQSITKPACSSGGAPRILFTAVAGDWFGQTSYFTQDVGASWTLRIIDGGGSPIAGGQGQVLVGCWFA